MSRDGRTHDLLMNVLWEDFDVDDEVPGVVQRLGGTFEEALAVARVLMERGLRLER